MRAFRLRFSFAHLFFPAFVAEPVVRNQLTWPAASCAKAIFLVAIFAVPASYHWHNILGRCLFHDFASPSWRPFVLAIVLVKQILSTYIIAHGSSLCFLCFLRAIVSLLAVLAF